MCVRAGMPGVFFVSSDIINYDVLIIFHFIGYSVYRIDMTFRSRSSMSGDGRGLGMNQAEHNEQVALFDWARQAEGRFPELGLLFAVPNGGARNVVTGTRLKVVMFL